MPGEDEEDLGACCIASDMLCLEEVSATECQDEGGQLSLETGCDEVCADYQVVGEQDEGLTPCCLSAQNACVVTDPGFCSEIGGMPSESCAQGCPDLADQTQIEEACCFDDFCELLAPGLCAAEGARPMTGMTCEATPCGA